MSPAESPTPSEFPALIARIEAELDELWFPTFDFADAHEIGRLLVERARQSALPIAIDVSKSGHTLFHVAMPGTTLDNDDWIARKTRAVNRFQVPSYLIGLRAANKGKAIEDEPWFDATQLAAHGGCFPVQVRGVGFVGTVTVSGLPQHLDHELVVGVLREFLANRP